MSIQLSGLKAWIVQRISSVYIALYFIIAMIAILINGMPDSHSEWQKLMTTPLVNIATMGLVIATGLHAWIGIRDIVLDYFKPMPVRFAGLVFFALFLMLCVLWLTRNLLVLLI